MAVSYFHDATAVWDVRRTAAQIMWLINSCLGVGGPQTGVRFLKNQTCENSNVSKYLAIFVPKKAHVGQFSESNNYSDD